MKKWLCVFVALILSFQGSIVLAGTSGNTEVIEWEEGYRESLDVNNIFASTITSDGNIWVAGSTEPGGYQDDNPSVTKMTPDGEVLWSKSYRQSIEEYAYVSAITEAKDGGILLAVMADHDTIIIKLDKNGNEKWQKQFGGDEDDLPVDIISTSDGGCLVCGAINSEDGDIANSKFGEITLERYFALKLDSKGNKQWSNVYGSGGGEEFEKVVPTKDGGYMLLGTSGSDYAESDIKHHGALDVWVVKIDKNGKEIWNKTYGGSEVDGLFCAAPCDGGIMMGAVTFSKDGDVASGDQFSRTWLFKLNESGKIIWEHYYDDDVLSRPLEIMQLPGGDFILTGSLGNYSEIVVLRLNKDGSIQWREEISYKFFNQSLTATSDGGFIIAGSTPGDSWKETAGHVIKFKPDQSDIDALELLKPYTAKYEDYAIKLSKINVFKGSGSGFALGRAPTRIEATVMFVRLLGGEKEALEKHYEHPFTDVPTWGSDYVGYLYHYRLTKGTGSATFGSSDAINANSYFTFILRALGYSDSNGEFVWNQSIEYGKKMLLLNEADYNELIKYTFYRDHLAKVSYIGLKMQLKGGGTLIQKLIDCNAINQDTAKEVGLIN